MKPRASGTTVDGQHEIWRMSIPAPAAAIRTGSLRHPPMSRLTRSPWRRWKPPNSFMSLLLGFVLFAQTSALPIHMGIFFMPRNAHAMTKGCKKGTCCTALCYVDKYGIHHCVHRPGDDCCECGMSTSDLNINPIMLSTVVTLPDAEHLLPTLIRTAYVSQVNVPIVDFDPATPSPPPK